MLRFFRAGISKGGEAAAIIIPLLALIVIVGFILYRRQEQKSRVTSFAKKPTPHRRDSSREGTGGVSNPLYALPTPPRDIQMGVMSPADPVSIVFFLK